jgi:hypothetical protein
LAGPRPGNLEVPLAGDCADFFVNGRKSSTQTLYLPSPILKKGKNEIIVFETEMLLAPCAESVDTAIL